MLNSSMLTGLKTETLAFLSRRILHPSFKEALEAMHRVHQTAGIEPCGLMVLGETGVGKTTVLRHYATGINEPAQQAGSGDAVPLPVVRINTPPSPFVKALLSALLESLGCTSPASGSSQAQFIRVKQLIHERSVSMLIVDEFQHMLREQAGRHTQDVINTIKNLMSECKVAVVLSGLPRAIQAIEHSDELKRRFGQIAVLQPMTCNNIDEERYFRNYLRAIDRVLPVSSIKLSSDSVSQRFYLASQGSPARISKIIQFTLQASDLSKELTISDYATGYQHAIAQVSSNHFNPFSATQRQVTDRLQKGRA